MHLAGEEIGGEGAQSDSGRLVTMSCFGMALGTLTRHVNSRSCYSCSFPFKHETMEGVRNFSQSHKRGQLWL